MNTAVLNQLLDQDFSVTSYCDFLSHCQKKVNSFIAEMGRLVDAADPDIDTENINFPTAEEMRQRLEQIGMKAESIIACDAGFITAENFIQQFEDNYALYYQGEISSLAEATIALTNNVGDTVNTSFNEVLDSVKTNLYASIAEKEALSAAALDGVSDRVTHFMSMIENKLDINDPGVMSSVNFYKEKLLSKFSPYELFDQFMSISGANELDADTNPYALQDFDISKFTGANPLGTLSFACVGDIAQSVGKVVGSVAKGIWSAVKTGANWLWNKAKKYTVEVFTDPYDVTDSGNKDAKYCFENFQYQRNFASYQYAGSGEGDIYLAGRGWGYQDVDDVAQGLIGHWYCIKTIGGEIAFKPTGIIIDTDPNNPNILRPSYTGYVLFKPYSLNPAITGSSLSEFISNASSFTEGMYLDCNASELDLFNSFTYGTAVTGNTLLAYAREISGLTYQWNPTYSNPGSSYTITNLDWLKKATGYRTLSGVDYFDTPTWGPQAAGSSCSLSAFGSYFLALLLVAKTNSNKLNNFYDEYVPYTEDTTGLSTGRFGIKTDAQNRNVATAFAAVIIVIVTVAVVIITGAVVLKKLAKKAFWKRTEFVGQSDNAMWNGATLSSKDKRKYIRYSRKLNASSLLSSGVSGAASLADTLASQSDTISSTVTSIIKGNSDEDDFGTVNTLSKLIKG